MKNKITISTRGIVLLITTLNLFLDAYAERPEKPNIVLIVTDDLGWQDLKCYDVDDPSPYDTPYLDALAKEGVMFWNAYSPATSCSPSRCAIISGDHPARAQKTHVLGGAPPYARSSSMMMAPWYSGRMPETTYTLARALKANGYTTGHMGKWHIAINHHAFPQPKDVGFDYTIATRGAHSGSGLSALSGFATDAEDDPYRLDKNGFPYHENNENAINFIREQKENPFFLYYCTWLVHTPIVTRNEALLMKYAQKMGVNPEEKFGQKSEGQTNPYYGAMVESLDYYMHQVFQYLETTEDPRWPGHMLSENTYIIFTSDNGGVVGYTDNSPLDKGKTSAKEGGTRVPLIVKGPGIPANVQSNVVVNGLDFYPTIMSLTHTDLPASKHLDGCDLAPLLLGDPKDSSLVLTSNGEVRKSMVWHHPHGSGFMSTIIEDGYKLIKNYDHMGADKAPPLELFQLYADPQGKHVRTDIEESNNLVDAMPDRAKDLLEKLTESLTEMKASYPCYNPHYEGELMNKDSIPQMVAVTEKEQIVTAKFVENGAKVVSAQLIYTLNGGDKYEEWFRAEMSRASANSYEIKLPEGTTHYVVNLVDENQFLVSFPSPTKHSARRFDWKTVALKPRP